MILLKTYQLYAGKATLYQPLISCYREVYSRPASSKTLYLSIENYSKTTKSKGFNESKSICNGHICQNHLAQNDEKKLIVQ